MNIFKITEEEKRRILNSHKSALIVKEQDNAFSKFKKEFPSSVTQSSTDTTQSSAAPVPAASAPASVPAPASASAPTEKKFEFKADPNVSSESGLKTQQITPQEFSKGIQSASKDTTATPGVKGNPNLAKLQQVLIDKFKINLGNTGPNKDGVDGFMGVKTANGIKKALESLKSLPSSEVTAKPDTAQQKKFEFKADPNVSSESGLKTQQITPQEFSKGIQTPSTEVKK